MFVGFTFLILFCTTILVASVAFLLYYLGIVKIENGDLLSSTLFLFILSSFVGIAFILMVGKMFVKPIKKFSDVSKEVAKGNFNIKLEVGSKITEVQEMSFNFNMMVHELSSIETLRSDFIANVSHEFKTPLSAIEGYATLLQEKELSSIERDEYVQMIIDSVQQLSTLTGNILSLSKLENQEKVYELSEFRLDEQIREIILLLENKWSEKNIELNINLDNVKYLGSKNLLRQVWLNLIDNAIKFTSNEGQITISLIEDKGRITFNVKDNGKGIDASEITHIFDKFYQSDTARNEIGNGLGLALVKRIVNLCHGIVTVESQLHVGSTFTVVLPVKINTINHAEHIQS